MSGGKEEGKTSNQSMAKEKLALLQNLPTADLDPSCISSVFQSISGVSVGIWQHLSL